MAIGPLDPAPIFPTPVAMQFVFDGHANEERELRVNPVNVSVPHGAATPALPNPPEMAIGVPELGELVVPMATQPVPAGGQTRLVRPVMLAGMVAAVHESTPAPEMVSTRTTAPVAVVPMATQVVADGQAICDSDVTPVRANRWTQWPVKAPRDWVDDHPAAHAADHVVPDPFALHRSGTGHRGDTGGGRGQAHRRPGRLIRPGADPALFSPVAMQVI